MQAKVPLLACLLATCTTYPRREHVVRTGRTTPASIHTATKRLLSGVKPGQHRNRDGL